MKEAILGALTLAAKHQKANNRIISEKADVVTQGELETGKIITRTLLNFKKCVTVESQEHGRQTNLKAGEEEKFYVAIDDIDGANNLHVGAGMLPYTSMIVAFDGSKKEQDKYKYSDYSHAACVDYINKRIYYTEKGLGKIDVYDLNFDKISDLGDNVQDNTNLVLTLGTDVVSTQRDGALGYAQSSNNDISVLPGILDSVYKNYATVDSGCSVFEYAMVGMGIRNGYVSSGKKQHELPLLYAFAKETGLEMVDFDGESYDDKIYDFNGKNAQVIAAAPEVVEHILSLIKKQAIVIKQIADILKDYREKTKLETKDTKTVTAPGDDGEVPL